MGEKKAAVVERVVDLSRHYPEFLRGVQEIRKLADAEGTEISRLYEGCDQLWGDGYIRTAGYQGIKRWESLLGIKPYPGDTLEERRAGVLLKWNQQLPYTLLRLQERLDATVKDAYELDVRPNVYELEIRVIDQTYRVLCLVREMIRNMIPANLLFILAGAYPVWFPVKTDVASRLEMSCAFYARYNRKFLYIDGTWLLDGTYKLNGYKEMESLDLYPAALTIRGSWRTTGKTGECVSCTARARADPELQSVSAVIGEVKVQRNNNATLRMLKQADVSPGVGSQLTVEKDLWYLDGTYMLDGSRLLDAEIFYYDL